MQEDQPFQSILIAAAVTVMPIVAYYRLRSQRTGEKLDRRQEGLLILLTLRPFGIAAMIALLVFMADPSKMAWSSFDMPRWLRWAGVGIGAAGGTLLIWTVHTLGKNLTDTVVTRKEHTLVTNGPYRFVRHPFYFAAALCCLANSLVTENWFIFLTSGAAVALIALRTRKEEANLLARFGSDYRAYQEKTGRFLPRVKRSKV